MSLNVVQRIKHNHARRNRHGIVHRLAAVLASSKYVQDRFGHRSALLDETFNGSAGLSLGTKDILPAVFLRAGVARAESAQCSPASFRILIQLLADARRIASSQRGGTSS